MVSESLLVAISGLRSSMQRTESMRLVSRKCQVFSSSGSSDSARGSAFGLTLPRIILIDTGHYKHTEKPNGRYFCDKSRPTGQLSIAMTQKSNVSHVGYPDASFHLAGSRSRMGY